MAIAYKSAGAGAATETSGAACSPASPAVVDAGDILIVHAYFEGTATAPNTPAGFTLLSGPHVIESTIGRHWIYGKIADGTEDGAANALGTAAVTTMRSGRCYSFSGRVAGTITDLVGGFAATSHATDPQMPSVTTTAAGALAVACVAQNDNNSAASATGESGGDWVEAVAEYTAALTPGLMLQIQTCIPTADPGTVSGGSVATTNDPCGVIGFEIRPDVPVISASLSRTLDAATVAGEADVEVVGSATPNLGAATAAGEADVEVQAQLARTLDDASLAAAGIVEDGGVSGSVVQTLGGVGMSSMIAVEVRASSAIGLGDATAAAAGAVDIAASAAPALEAAASVAEADVSVAGQAATQLADVVSAAEADVTVTAQVGGALADATVAATASSLPEIQAAAVIQLDGAAVTATAQTLDDDTASQELGPGGSLRVGVRGHRRLAIES